MTEAARLVDELTTMLYEVTTGWDDSAGGHQIVRCGACRRKADRAESVVHKYDCPVYRLIRAEEANTAVIRANAEEIADLEDKRDELEAQVNALTALLAERDAATVRLLDATAKMEEALFEIRDYCAEVHDGDTLERLAYRVVGMANGAINDYYAALAGGEVRDGK